MSIYFSKNDPFGIESPANVNFENHKALHSHYWGSNKQVKKLFPRGNVYWKLLTNQFTTL